MRTLDSGRAWQDLTPPGGEAEFLRDVEAFDRDHAVVLAVGDATSGDRSRIYRTADGGVTWQVVFQNRDLREAYSCMAFFDHRHGLAVSDPVDGRFRLLATHDGGRTWRPAPPRRLPQALDGEFTLGVNGTCLVAAGPHDAWFGTATSFGPSPVPTPNGRVFHTPDKGRTWTAATTPIPGNPLGIFSLSFRDRRHGLAVGGNIPFPPGTADESTVARTFDAGRSWQRGGAPAGARTGVAWIPGPAQAAVVVGFNGSDVSFDGGRTWTLFDRTQLLGINCLPQLTCWAVGAHGQAAKLTIKHHTTKHTTR
ncbi:WD40/YVTN/BNR-like repeat-containing protein [Spirillospora sp. NPDC048911]|uniref:WD40/YVTN/BNR-like repeat-containing protein n=1 Tax=Spirillospora sp. NPDC048911 TaxID=3364527 RepID=UPI0037140886